MGMFDKKFCDVCGEKIGMIVTRKLDDGNLCKDCARKLSPFFSERRHSTVEEIKQQLAYREQNKQNLASFNPTMELGTGMKIYIDQAAGAFICTRSSNWRADNPDIIPLGAVTGCEVEIDEDRDEIYMRDANGQNRSYNPPRYKYSYKMDYKIGVNTPYFTEIEFELTSGNRPDSMQSLEYQNYLNTANQISMALCGRPVGITGDGAGSNLNAGMMAGGMGMNMGMGMNGMAMNNGMGMNSMAMNNGMGMNGMPMNNGMGMNGMPMNNGMGMNGMPMNNGMGMNGMPMNNGYVQNNMAMNNGMGMNNGYAQNNMGMNAGMGQNFGAPVIRCDKCGWMPVPGAQIPAVCPQCGDPINQADLA
ncbi:MAG: DUF4428 domain-containing protein [Clostridia bacterium]|nr:DUF4428 domain-containing protein [Clostridia bacterium]